jgi:hypothetical protein
MTRYPCGQRASRLIMLRQPWFGCASHMGHATLNGVLVVMLVVMT